VLQRVLRGEVAQMNMPGREVEPGASIIGPSWIGHGSRIRAGAKVVRSILFEYTRIAADMRFTEMIVSPTYCVDRHGDTQYRGDERAKLRWGDARG
jgi:mannose-1-phosphate guanylyltransferase